MLPLKLLVSTVVNTTGTSKIRVALARATVLLMIDSAVEVRGSEQHLGLMVDERHDTVVRCEESFFSAFDASVILRHGFPFFLKRVLKLFPPAG